MKLTALLLFAACLQVCAEGNAQNISISQRNTTLEKVFKEIHRKTAYQFFYHDELLQQSNRFDISVKNASIEQVLEICFKNQPLNFSITENTITIKKKMVPIVHNIPLPPPPAVIELTGKVKDESGQPMAGVSISIVGKKGGVITDDRGDFSISVQENAVLSFSYINYQTVTMTVKGKTSLEVTLKLVTSSLGDVVVIGYGTRKKETLTGAVSRVSGDELKSSPAPNLTNSIAGRIPGMIVVNGSGQPGSDGASLNIRGFGTLGDNSPLIVIDGVANRGGMERINPNDVESFTVLKDASAAIYGAQAANGVIIITTKKGKTGKSSFDYSFNQGWTRPTKKLALANAFDYASYRNEYYRNAGQPAEFTDEQLEKMKTGADPDRNLANTDWWDETVKKSSPIQRHNISISGGSENIKYFLSGNYVSQDGVFKNSAAGFRQAGYRSKIEAQVTKNFSVGLNLYGQYEETATPNAASQRDTWLLLVKTAPYYPAFYNNGLPWRGIENGWNPAVVGTDIGGIAKNKMNTSQNLLNFEWKLPFIKGLSVDGFAAFDKSTNPYRSVANPYSLYEFTNGEYVLKNVSSVKNVELRLSTYQNTSVTLNAKINYNRIFGNHNINAFVAYEQNESWGSGFNASRNNLLTDRNAEFFLGSNDGKDNGSSSYENARQNYFGRASYGFKSKYFLDFSLRYDGSQNFPTEKRFGLFPSVLGAWRISEEAFFKQHVPFMNNLKLRASIGQLGNDKIGSFQYLTTYNISSDSYIFGGENVVGGISPGTTPNPNISWEVATSTNIGLEAGFFNRLIEIEAEIFQSKRSNILARRNLSIPDYLGFQLPLENIGEVKNKGFELVLSHNHSLGKLKYRVSGNYSFARNKIIDIDESAGANPYQLRTGHRMDADLYYPTDGLYKNQKEVDAAKAIYGTSIKPGDIKFVDTNNDGKIDGTDRVRLDKGINFPESMYGFNISASIGRFDMRLLFQGAAKIYKYLNTFDAGIRGNYLKDFFTDRWTVQNENGNWPRANESPRPDNNTQDSRITFYLKDASYLRLKSTEIGYSLPENWLKKARVNSLRLYTNGFNLLFVHNKLKYLDPEASDDRFGYYPQQRIINVGAVVSF